ncbi:hypothetical protein ES703_66675 [subsurface metagenome]
MQGVLYQLPALGLGPGKVKLGYRSSEHVVNFIERVIHLKGVLEDDLYLPLEL